MWLDWTKVARELEVKDVVLLGEFVDQDTANFAMDQARSIAKLYGREELVLTSATKVLVYAKRSGKLNGKAGGQLDALTATVLADKTFFCKMHDRPFGSAQALAAHKTMAHKKKGKK